MGTRRRRVSVKQYRSKLNKWDDLRMKTFSNPTHNDIKRAAKALKDGHLVAFPTETVYGLGADAINEKAVSRIYLAKGRPTDHPLIVHISSIKQLDKWAIDIPEYAIKLSSEFWPGPMTLILKRSSLAKDFITGGQENIGLRVPANPIALVLITEFEKIGGSGIAAPSANRFGAVSPTTAEAVEEELGKFLSQEYSILNGGQCKVGIESTIIDCTEDSPKILRPGAITQEMIKKVLCVNKISKHSESNVKSSGLLGSHYSPRAKVVLNAVAVPGEGLLAMDGIPTPTGVIRLDSPKNIEQYAKGLYQALRFGDQKGLERIVVITPVGDGIAEAVRDRIIKAAAG
jgi:L-threonylcarbamoyladenylate synthase